MADTTHLGLPGVSAGIAGWDTTINTGLIMLDGLVGMSVLDRDLATPPGSPADGDRYIVAASATGAWSGWENSVAMFVTTGWLRLQPQTGWRAWAADENLMLTYDGTAWREGFSDQIVARSANDARMGFHILEEALSGLTGASVDSTISIPNGAVVFGVSERVTTQITGATSFGVGIVGETGKFGSGLSVSAGATNHGVIGPTAFYAATPIRLTSAGGNFTGGAVRIGIHYYLGQPPQS